MPSIISLVAPGICAVIKTAISSPSIRSWCPIMSLRPCWGHASSGPRARGTFLHTGAPELARSGPLPHTPSRNDRDHAYQAHRYRHADLLEIVGHPKVTDDKSGNTGREDAGTAQRRPPTAPECESPQGENGSDRAEQANDGDSATGCLFNGF